MGRMTNLILAIVLALVAMLPSCGSLPPSRDDLTALAQRVDKNQDGQITKAELKQAGGDYTLWITAGTALLGLFGLGKATAASNSAALAQSHVDDLHDKLTVPATKA